MSSGALSITSTIKLNNGLDMPMFGLGTWRSDTGLVAAAVEAALKHGYRHIDCAHVYQNQHEVAQGLKAAMDAGIRREDVWITSKLWNKDHRPERVRPALEEVLKQLGVEQLDLFLIHWPSPFKPGDEFFPPYGNEIPSVPELKFDTDTGVTLEETWKALEACVDAGLVKAIGVSNFSTALVDRVLAAARIKPVVNQVEVHPYLNQKQLIKDMTERGVVVTAYSPLGNVRSDMPSCLTDDVIKAVAAKHGKSAGQVLIRWALQRGTIVIPKTVTISRIAENADVFGWELDADDMTKIDALGARNLRMINPPFYPEGKRVHDE